MKSSRYYNYNDYKLLYLINEGSEEAYEILLDKYDKLIYKIASKIYPYGDKMMDLVQEGRMILFKCIEKYKDDGGASFYSYFRISLERRFYNLVKNDSYYQQTSIEDSANVYSNDLTGVNIHKGYRYFNNELEIRMFDECLINGMSIKDFASKYNLKYSKAYSIHKEIISSLKRTFSID